MVGVGGRALLFESRLVTADFVPSVLFPFLSSGLGPPQVHSRRFFLGGCDCRVPGDVWCSLRTAGTLSSDLVETCGDPSIIQVE